MITTGAYVISVGRERRYVGSSARSIENRISYHLARLRKGSHYNKELQRDYTDTKLFSYKLYACAAEEAQHLEQRKIDYWSARSRCYNRQPSAFSAKGTKYTEDSKIKIAASAAARCAPEWRAAVSERVRRQHAENKFGRATWSEETMRQQAQKMRGKPNVMKGKTYGPEHGAKISAKLTGKPKSPEHIRNAVLGRWNAAARRAGKPERTSL